MENLTLIRDFGLLEKTLKRYAKGIFSEGDRVAVKIHMGEINNPYYLSPDIIKRVIAVLKELKLKPFLFDSVVLYSGERDTVAKYKNTAKKHGFTEETVGCPIIISDTGVDVKMEDLVFHVCKELSEAEGLLNASHVKGHCCYGFGGAIKNLGMGGVTPKSKEDIHTAQYVESDKLLAESAKAVLSFFKKVLHVNFIINIAKDCDCCNNAGPIVADDIGILFSKNIVAVDKASIDLIYRQKPGIFEKLHKKDPYLQIKYAEELGMGDGKYDIS